MKNVLKCLLFGIILFLLVELEAFLLMPNKGLKKYSFYEKAAFNILEEEPDTVDVIALGDSLIYSSINPLQIWHEYGFTIYDCAEPAYFMKDAYHNLKVSIASQSPKIVLMEANMLFRDVKNYPWYVKLEKKLEKFVPIEKYHNNWKKIITNSKEGSDINKGYKYITKVVPSKNYNYMKYSDEFRKIPGDNLEYFKKIVQLAKDNNVKFVLISTPSQESYNYPRRRTAEKLSKEMDFDFVDLNLNDPVKIDWTKETKDKGGHLNYLGAIKVSKYIGAYLDSLNLLEDHRNDEKYESWNTAYNKFKNSK